MVLTRKKVKICCVASIDITLKFMLLNQLKFLKNQGYEVHAVCAQGKWIKSIEEEGIKIKIIKFSRKFFTPIADLAAFIKLFFYFRKEKFDIVHTHTLKPEFYGQIAAKLAGTPIIINTIHGFDFGEETSLFKKRLFVFLEKISAKYSDTIFTVSNSVIKTVIEEKICQSRSLKYLGRDIDIGRFDPKRFSEEFILNKKNELGIKPDKKIIGIVARLVEEKGYLELFDALIKVLNVFPGTLLLIVGPEEPEKKDAINYNTIKKYGIEKNVMFLGEKEDVEEIYCLMDIFVLPTHREGIGASILEASAMARPVIATNTGGCPEAVEEGKTGILVPMKNSNKISEAIIYLFKNPKVASQMGVAGREKILREFSKNIVFDRLGAGYKELIKNKL
jgi:glycosyltransferase involved in cell wall biosynthesis